MNNNENKSINKKNRSLKVMVIVVFIITVISLGFSFYICSYTNSKTGVTGMESLTGLLKIKLPSIKLPNIKLPGIKIPSIRSYNKKYTITFDTNDVNKKIKDQIVKYGKKIKKPVEIIKKGYKLVGWKHNGKYWNFKNKVTSNLNLVAQYTPNRLNCVQEKNITGTKVDLCVNSLVLPNVVGDDHHRLMQNFAITDKYVYFAGHLEGGWFEKNSDSNYRKSARGYIVRYDRKDFNSYKVFKIEYGGHIYSFDTRMEALSSGENVDKILIDNGSYKYHSEYMKKSGYSSYGARGSGITYMTLPEGQDYRETEYIKNSPSETVIPERSMFIDVENERVKLLKYNSKNGNPSDYYNSLNKIVEEKNNKGEDRKYKHASYSIKGNYIAQKMGSKVRVYNFNELLNGKIKIYAEYKDSTSSKYGALQGVAMTNRTITGDKNNLEVLTLSQSGNNINIIRYNKDNKNDFQAIAKINVNGRYHGKDNFEVEGIKVYGDYIYIGVANRYSSPKGNDVIRVKYSDLVWTKN